MAPARPIHEVGELVLHRSLDFVPLETGEAIDKVNVGDCPDPGRSRATHGIFKDRASMNQDLGATRSGHTILAIVQHHLADAPLEMVEGMLRDDASQDFTDTDWSWCDAALFF